jgi:hypothetical protein
MRKVVLTMKMLVLVLAGMSLPFAIPFLARGDKLPSLPLASKDYYNETITVEIQGKLRKVIEEVWPWKLMEKADKPKFPMPSPMPKPIKITRWEITINGTIYELDFGSNKELRDLAEKLNGKTVRLSGRLIYRLRERHFPPGLERPMIAYKPYKQAVVVVSALEAVEDAFVRETMNVVLRGKLEVDVPFGYPVARKVATVIHVNGKTYALDFGANETLHQLAKKLNGQVVTLTGTFGGTWVIPSMCHPIELPTVKVGRLHSGKDVEIPTNTVEIKGKLGMIQGEITTFNWPPQANKQGLVTEYFVTVNWKKYNLRLSEKLEKLAEKLAGKTVVLTGTLKDGQVIVSTLRAAQGDYVRRWDSVEIRGQLIFPDIEQSKALTDVSCMITVNGKGYWLILDSKLLQQAKQWQGRTVVVTGTVEQRPGLRVVHVTDLKVAAKRNLPTSPPPNILKPRRYPSLFTRRCREELSWDGWRGSALPRYGLRATARQRVQRPRDAVASNEPGLLPVRRPRRSPQSLRADRPRPGHERRSGRVHRLSWCLSCRRGEKGLQGSGRGDAIPRPQGHRAQSGRSQAYPPALAIHDSFSREW